MKRQLSKSILFLCFIVFSLVSFAKAETENQPQFIEFEKKSIQAELLLNQQNITVSELERARQQLIKLRETSQGIIEEDKIFLSTFQMQLDAVGPTLSDDSIESEEITERRKKLQKDISDKKEELLKVEELVQGLNALIKETDLNIRKKSTITLLSRGSSPLNVTNWNAAIIELTNALKQEKEEFIALFEDPYTRSVLMDRLPISFSLFILGIITITVIRTVLMRHLFEKYHQNEGDKLVNWQALSINLAHIGLPFLSIGLFLSGFYLLQLDVYGLKKTTSLVPLVIIFIAIGHWLGHSLFSPNQPDLRIFHVNDKDARVGYRILLLLGFTLSVLTGQGLLEVGYDFTETSKAIITLPIILVGSVLLWLLSSKIIKASRNISSRKANNDTELAIQKTLLRIFTVLLRASAVLSITFILLGFTNLSRDILGPMLATVAILCLCFFVFEVVLNISAPLINQKNRATESTPTLLPIIVIILIFMFALPVLALNWGVRWATLQDIWRVLNEGVRIGETRFSLEILFLLAVVFLVGLGITRWIQKLIRVAILPRTKLDLGGQNALITGIGYLGITLSALVAVSSAGLDLSSLAIFAGALSVGIGFGLQTIASNFVSGVILLIERPIKEGDWIDVAGYSGYVRRISVRSTRIETFDRHDVIVPNAELVSGVVKNMTLTGSTGRVIIPVGVAYGTDAENVKQLLIKIASDHSMVLNYPEPAVLFMGLGESSIDFELRCFVKDVNSMLSVRSDIYFSVYKTFEENGIEIPFPQRVISMREND